jgi:hypothetical protein
MQYLKALEYHNFHNIKPPISLKKQFQITKSDRFIINKYLQQKELQNKDKKIGPDPIMIKKNKSIGPKKTDDQMMKYKLEIEDAYKDFNTLKKPVTKCNENSCSIYSSVHAFDRSLMGDKLEETRQRHPLTYDFNDLYENKPSLSNDIIGKSSTAQDTIFSSHRDSHPYMYNNDIVSRKSPYTTDTRTMNRLVIDEQMKEKKQPKFSETIKTSCNTCNYVSDRGDLDPGNKIRINSNCNDSNRDGKRDQPMKYMSFDHIKYNNVPITYKKNSHMYGNIIDNDSILRNSVPQDRKKGVYMSNIDTENKWIDYKNTECRKIPNREQVQYKTTPFMGHGKGMGNVDVESSMLHAEPSRIPGHNDLGGISINRFEDLFVNIQEKSIYPFDFPRGGINSRDPILYDNQPGRII